MLRMNRLNQMLASAGCVALLALTTATASAATTTASGSGQPAGLTRAQVQAQLCQAEQAGLVPQTNVGPPDAATIARNKAEFARGNIRCSAGT